MQHERHLQLERQACACLLGVLILCATTMMQRLIAVRWGGFLNKELICAVTARAKNRARWLKAVPHLASGWPESFKVQRSHWNSRSRLSLCHRLLPAHTADVYIIMDVPQPLWTLPCAADTLALLTSRASALVDAWTSCPSGRGVKEQNVCLPAHWAYDSWRQLCHACLGLIV